MLCEKPLAESHAEAEQIRAAAAASGTHVVVGAMHVYDPAYRAAHRAWVEENERSVFTQSAIFLPSNDMFTGQATEPASTFPPNSSGAGVADAVMLRGAITGLAVHNLPLVRDFCPRLGQRRDGAFHPAVRVRGRGHRRRTNHRTARVHGRCMAAALDVANGGQEQ